MEKSVKTYQLIFLGITIFLLIIVSNIVSWTNAYTVWSDFPDGEGKGVLFKAPPFLLGMLLVVFVGALIVILSEPR